LRDGAGMGWDPWSDGDAMEGILVF
jgi:hypothetical protein